MTVTTAKVAISLDPELLARLDAEASAAGQSRSAFMRMSLRALLDTLEEERTLRQARALYHELEAEPELLRLHDAFLTAARETLPPYQLSAPADDTGAIAP